NTTPATGSSPAPVVAPKISSPLFPPASPLGRSLAGENSDGNMTVQNPLLLPCTNSEDFAQCLAFCSATKFGTRRGGADEEQAAKKYFRGPSRFWLRNTLM